MLDFMPLEPVYPVSGQQSLFNPHKTWTPAASVVVFNRLLHLNPDDEQAAYDALLAQGCPLTLADAAWDSWVRGAGHVVC